MLSEPTTKKWEELKSKKDKLKSIGKQSVESVLKKKSKAMVGRICRKGSF